MGDIDKAERGGGRGGERGVCRFVWGGILGKCWVRGGGFIEGGGIY